jgi:ABC-type branched-subunit amino acid transport system ATPase component
MKFYNREKELELLQSIDVRASSSAQMTVVVGRRRIGKTSIVETCSNYCLIYRLKMIMLHLLKHLFPVLHIHRSIGFSY